jgi:hypothetical protein
MNGREPGVTAATLLPISPPDKVESWQPGAIEPT